jgi:hypothetical protein
MSEESSDHTLEDNNELQSRRGDSMRSAYDLAVVNRILSWIEGAEVREVGEGYSRKGTNVVVAGNCAGVGRTQGLVRPDLIPSSASFGE